MREESSRFGGSVTLKGRPGLPIVPAWQFYPSYIAETVTKLLQWASIYLQLRRIYLRVKRDSRRLDYTGLALAPMSDDEIESRDLFHTRAAESYVALVRPEGMRQAEMA